MLTIIATILGFLNWFLRAFVIMKTIIWFFPMIPITYKMAIGIVGIVNFFLMELTPTEKDMNKVISQVLGSMIASIIILFINYLIYLMF